MFSILVKNGPNGSHLPWVNGFLLEPFMTCTDFSSQLWQSSSTDQGTRKKVASPARSKELISNDKCQTCQGIHQDRQTCTKPGKTQLLDPRLLGQILEDSE